MQFYTPQGPYIGTINKSLQVLKPILTFSLLLASQIVIELQNMNPSSISCETKDKQNATLHQRSYFWP